MFPNQPGQQPYQPPTQPQPPYQPVQPQQPASPLDYLNQIAPQQSAKKSMFKGLRGIIFIGLGLVVIVSILALALNLATSGQSKPPQQLAARLASTQKIADSAQANLKSSELRSVNSNLRIFFANTNRDSAEPLLAVDVTVGKLDKEVSAAESVRFTAIDDRLEDARLNAIFDRTYAREMAYELSTIMTLLQQVYSQTTSTSLKEFIDTTYKNLEPTQKAFADYNEGS